MNRSSAEICYDILSIAKKRVIVSRIRYKAGISSRQLNHYLPALFAQGMILSEDDGKLMTTPEGIDFLIEYDRLNGNPQMEKAKNSAVKTF